MTGKRWVWVVLFIVVVLLLAVLATGWNLVLVHDYRKIVELGRALSAPEAATHAGVPRVSLVLGTLGFLGALSLTIAFFVKLLKEMQLNQLQSEFLAAVSHELKTPLSTMELSTSLLRDPTTSPEDVQRLWTSHDAELKRLKEEVETLLEVAQWESKTIKLKRSPIVLETWLHDSFDRWKKILGYGSEILRQGDSLDCTVTVDLKMLNLITDNLIDNARKFSNDSPRVLISSSLVPAKKPWSLPRWRIEFRDQGWGFDPADSTKIFKRFYRSKSQAPYSIAGTGLGLYLAASASRSMGIHLTAESQGKGHGAVFILEGPFKK